MLRSIEYLKRKKEKLEQHRLLSNKYKRDTGDDYYHRYSNACKKTISRYEDKITWRHLVLHVTILALLMIAMFGFVAASKTENSPTGHVVDLRDIASDTKLVIALVVVVVLVILTIAVLAAMDQKKAAAIVLILFMLAVAGFVMLGPFEGAKDEEDIISGGRQAIERAEERAKNAESQAAEARAKADASKAEKLQNQVDTLKQQISDLNRAIAARDTQTIVRVEKEVGGGIGAGGIIAIVLIMLALGGGGLAIGSKFGKKKEEVSAPAAVTPVPEEKVEKEIKERYTNFVKRMYKIHNDFKSAIDMKEELASDVKERAKGLPKGNGAEEEDLAHYHDKEHLDSVGEMVHGYLENKHINEQIVSLCDGEIMTFGVEYRRLEQRKDDFNKLGISITLFDNPMLIYRELGSLFTQMKNAVGIAGTKEYHFGPVFKVLHDFCEKKSHPPIPDAMWKTNTIAYADAVDVTELRRILGLIDEKLAEIMRERDAFEAVDEVRLREVVTGFKVIQGWLDEARDIYDWINLKTEFYTNANQSIPQKFKSLEEKVDKFHVNIDRYLKTWPYEGSGFTKLSLEWDEIKKDKNEIIKKGLSKKE